MLLCELCDFCDDGVPQRVKTGVKARVSFTESTVVAKAESSDAASTSVGELCDVCARA